MATRPGRMITYLDGFLPLNLHDLLITWSFELTWEHKTIISPIPRSLKLGVMVTYFEGLLTMKPNNASITWSNKNHYTSNTRVPLDISFARMITFLDVLQSIKPHDPLLTGPCKTTWQTKTIVSPIPGCLCPSNMLRWWVTSTVFYP